jgi:hypothetical protein
VQPGHEDGDGTIPQGREAHLLLARRTADAVCRDLQETHHARILVLERANGAPMLRWLRDKGTASISGFVHSGRTPENSIFAGRGSKRSRRPRLTSGDGRLRSHRQAAVEGRRRRTACPISRLVQLPLVITATVLVPGPPTYCSTCCPSHTRYSKIPERRESFEQAFPDVEIERPEGQSGCEMGQSTSGNGRGHWPVLADSPRSTRPLGRTRTSGRW